MRSRGEALRHSADRTGVKFREHCDTGTDLAWCTVAALQTVMLHESSLHFFAQARANQSFNRDNILALVLHSKCKTRIDSLTLGENGACSTCALIAPLLSACEVEVFAQAV